jgi:leucyl/phenylalanyl-tRNA--protein transferase
MMTEQPRVALLDETIGFPPLHEAWEGLLAIGGDLNEARLIAAYEGGIFPWYGENEPILWWAPEKRCIVRLEDLKISKSMRNVLNRKDFTVKTDTKFEEVVRNCGELRKDGEGTWISEEIIQAYLRLHELGLAHSFETWRNGKLIGGLYGVSIGHMFFGESMYSSESNASKIAFIHLIEWAKRNNFGPIDCQIQNNHLNSLGAIEIQRDEFMSLLRTHLNNGKTIRGSWNLQIGDMN